MNLAEAFDQAALSRAQKTAVFWDEKEFSFAALRQMSITVAGELTRKFGVKPGDRVGLWLKNCPEFIPALFGILRAGAVVVPINNFSQAG